MPWKVNPVHEVRFALVHAVRHLNISVAVAARQFGVSRRVAYKWLARHDAEPDAALVDRSRRPRSSPARTAGDIERQVLGVRDRFNWGPRKIHFYLLQQHRDLSPGQVPAIRTIADILRRHDRIAVKAPTPQATARFERAMPNALWQLDFKGPVEVDRRKLMPLSILDDHSRYCLAYQPCTDVTMDSAWNVLWNVFGDVGLPEQILADNAFNTMGTPRPAGISAFDAKLVRLGITPSHGRPYHPQTQGKVERLNGSSMRELIDFNARRDCREYFENDCRTGGASTTPSALTKHSAINRPSHAGVPAPGHARRSCPKSSMIQARSSAPSAAPASSASTAAASSADVASRNNTFKSRSMIMN